MRGEIINFIRENKLSPFNKGKTTIRQNNSIYKTQDAKKVHTKTISTISKNFKFSETSNLFSLFQFTNSKEEIEKRQDFFKKIKSFGKLENQFLEKIKAPRKWWKPKYDVVIVTEDAETFNKLRKMDCPVQMIISEQDISMLESRDIVQIINCPEYQIALESLPQSVFLRSLDEAYLERHLEEFSGWIENIELLSQERSTKSLKELSKKILPLKKLTNLEEIDKLDRNEIETKVIEANQLIEEKLKEKTLTGMNLVNILSKGVLPEEIKEIINETIEEKNIQRNILEIGIPLKIDEEELEKKINEQEKTGFSKLAEEIKEYSNELKDIPKILKEILELLLFFDFISGVSQYMKENFEFPKSSENIIIEKSNNVFLENPQPISFNLKDEIKCSILTGANSGGKTTLIEHLLQLVSLHQIGLPTSGKIEMPLFEEIYYFAKNKGSNLKGAFETLLTQMSKIKPGNKTLILADEIEAVTEPGVAGNIISATAKYYIQKNCFLVIATHLGYEIQKILPENSRIDGIEATGLTEDFELIVNHNPVLGRLANSTPELIVEKMAKKEQKDYFKFLNKFLKKN